MLAPATWGKQASSSTGMRRRSRGCPALTAKVGSRHRQTHRSGPPGTLAHRHEREPRRPPQRSRRGLLGPARPRCGMRPVPGASVNVRKSDGPCPHERSAPQGSPEGPDSAAQLAGRSSQVKGAYGVAPRWRKRHPGPASLHGPARQMHRQTGGLPVVTRGTAGLGVHEGASLPGGLGSRNGQPTWRKTCATKLAPPQSAASPQEVQNRPSMTVADQHLSTPQTCRSEGMFGVLGEVIVGAQNRL